MEESGSNVGKMKGEETEARTEGNHLQVRVLYFPVPSLHRAAMGTTADADARWTDGLPGGAPSCRSSVGVGGDQARVARRENKSKRKTGKAEGVEGGGWRLH